MTEDKKENVIVYILDDYRKPKPEPVEEEEEDEDDRYDVTITISSEDQEISVSKNLWNVMVENGYDPTDFEEHIKFLDDLKDDE
tara:strand:- start:1219 stop:1470 length:252 start_codon:yes stop_codon:yes gene_type:complete